MSSQRLEYVTLITSLAAKRDLKCDVFRYFSSVKYILLKISFCPYQCPTFPVSISGKCIKFFIFFAVFCVRTLTITNSAKLSNFCISGITALLRDVIQFYKVVYQVSLEFSSFCTFSYLFVAISAQTVAKLTGTSWVNDVVVTYVHTWKIPHYSQQSECGNIGKCPLKKV